MGRVKTSLIKRSAQQLFEGIDLFGSNFEHNKTLLSDKMPSKSVRNKIAGQLVNLSKKKNAPKKVKDEGELKAEFKDNSGNYSKNSQNSLMDNSEKRIPINRIIHN